MKRKSVLKAIGMSGVALGLMMLSAHAVEVYVSPTGADTNDGTKQAPFATLERARDAIRATRQAGETKLQLVVLRPGRYERTAPFELTAEDYRTIYMSMNEDNAVGGSIVSGGFLVHGGNI